MKEQVKQIKNNQTENIKEEQTMEKQYIPMDIIPNYIINSSLNYNKYILSIFLYLKTRANKNGTIYFNYKNLIECFEYDKIKNKNKKEEFFKALLFLLLGANIEILGNNNQIIDTNEIINSFRIDNTNNILINLLENIKIQINEETSQLILLNTNKELSIELILNMIEKYLDNSSEIILHDLTTKNIKGFIYIESECLDFLFWYYRKQNKNFNKINTNYQLIDEKKLNSLKKEFSLLDIPTKNINFTTLINIYLYIYKLYSLNKNLKQRTYISYNKISTTCKISNNTTLLYLNILEQIELIKIKKGTFQGTKVTSFVILSDWKKLNNINKNIFKYNIISQENFNEIQLCFKRKENATDTKSIETSITQTKRKRGRPKKNNII